MSAIVCMIDSVVPYGDNLSIVKVAGQQVIANRQEDGNFRWTPGEIAVYVEENSIIPVDVLKERGYWDFEKDRGYLDGGQRNRVKARKMGPDKEPTVGLLFKAEQIYDVDKNPMCIIDRGQNSITVNLGDDVADFFGITEYIPA